MAPARNNKVSKSAAIFEGDDFAGVKRSLVLVCVPKNFKKIRKDGEDEVEDEVEEGVEVIDLVEEEKKEEEKEVEKKK
jgi:hypothetical protein